MPRPGTSGCVIVLAGTKQPSRIVVIVFKEASGTTTVTIGRTPRAESNPVKLIITHADARVYQVINFDDFESSDKDSDEDGHADDNDVVVLSHEAEQRSLHVGHVIDPRGIDRRQVDERNEEKDRDQGVTPNGRPR